MSELLTREDEVMYSMVDQKWLPYYEQFGFRQVEVSKLPPDFGKKYRIGRIVTSLISVFSKQKLRIIPLKRE